MRSQYQHSYNTGLVFVQYSIIPILPGTVAGSTVPGCPVLYSEHLQLVPAHYTSNCDITLVGFKIGFTLF